MACMTYEEFVASCRVLLQVSKELGDSWVMCHSASDSSTIYLSKTQCFKADMPTPISELTAEKSESPDEIEKLIEDFTQEPEPPDPSSVSNSTPGYIITYEYHIVYSLSHSVPALYFNAWYASGKLLTLQEIWERVSNQFCEQIADNKWNSLTQTEHPVLGRPFFQLHPCRTAELMNIVCCESEQTPKDVKKYLISWLSMFGPVVGLEVPITYYNK
ncbi:hypothetical protein Pmani_024999 [Petrolisthes manimaculis]|uniref:Ubiquitin-like-conjugating enzyme ATG10 n=1 Tax=Petrolisthes manimaculis TaxID=1843537 RepID=A0AAE1TYT1_9EUCA|nr:hypothetical protein Pmani_024999 [Petrolisthes manimaculis]